MWLKIKIIFIAIIMAWLAVFQSLPRAHAATLMWEIQAIQGNITQWMPYSITVTPTPTEITALYPDSEYKVVWKRQNGFLYLLSSSKPFSVYYSQSDYDETRFQYHMFITTNEPNQQFYSTFLGESNLARNSEIKSTGKYLSQPDIPDALQFPEPTKTGPLPSYDFAITDITSTSAIIKWKNLSSRTTKFRLRINGTAMADDFIVTIPATIGDMQYKLTGLQLGKSYNVYIRGEDDDAQTVESVKSFWTSASNTENLSVYVGNNTWGQTETFWMEPIQDITVKSAGYSKVDFYINEQKIGDQQTVNLDGNKLLGSDYQQYVSNQHPNFLKIVMTSLTGGTKSFYYSFNVKNSGTNPTDPGAEIPGYDPGDFDGVDPNGPDFPQQPTAPDNAWDLIGWVKYIVDWLIYLVKVVTFVLVSAGNMIRQLVTATGNFSTVLMQFFSFLPNQIVSLIGVGITLAIILRVFKR